MRGRAAKLGLTLLAALALGTALPARAQLTFSIIDPDQTAAPGDTLTFHATLTNNTGAPIFVNGVAVATGSLAPGGQSPFLQSFPNPLANGQSFTEAFVSLNVDKTVAPGTYSGTASVLGGMGELDLILLAGSDFRVRVVQEDVTVIPEPGSLALFAGGLAPFGVMLRRRRRG